MNRKSSIAAAAIAAILIFLFSQAYVKRIQKANSKHKDKSESSVISRDEFNAEIGNIYIENPQETQPEVPEESSDSQLYIINENNEIVPVEEQTTESKSLLERRKKKNEDSQLYVLNENNDLVPTEEPTTEPESLLERRKIRNENKDKSNEAIENNNNE